MLYINIINNYNGKKFYPKKKSDGSDDVIVTYDLFGNKIIKQKFCLTRSYRKYLEEKEEQKRKFEIHKLKAKLDYEFATTGEVDDIDYQRYCKLIGLTK